MSVRIPSKAELTDGMSPTRVLRLDTVSKSFGSDTLLFKDFSFEIAPAQSIAILGPSGSGKSTLLYIMGGLVHPDSGRVLIEERECNKQAQWDRVRARTIGFVFQGSCLLPSLTAMENLELPMIGIEPSKRTRQERASELLANLNLTSRAFVRAANLSGGERQRVAIARALVNRPQLILADEPTGNLDAKNTTLVTQILHDLCWKGGASLVIATHDPDVAMTCKTHVVLGNQKIEVRQNEE